MGRLTTHVLDTAHGRPAAGLHIALYRLGDSGEALVADAITNADGRTEAALLEGDALTPGVYELRFALGAYFAAVGVALPEPPFLDVVPVRFGIANPAGHYHVPLLASPWAYSTYRGS
ncbi:hydroxyisourate hydrolase [Chloroflexales bacterium ZM16-3]|nr:hydroxyisourate hydrolase [Chloroflexales bacterium ZM16-3]